MLCRTLFYFRPSALNAYFIHYCVLFQLIKMLRILLLCLMQLVLSVEWVRNQCITHFNLLLTKKRLLLPTTCSDQSDQTACLVPAFLLGLGLLQYFRSSILFFYSKHFSFNGLVKHCSVDEMDKCNRTKRECNSLDSCLSIFFAGLNQGL